MELQCDYNNLKIELDELKSEFLKYKLRTEELSDYNIKLSPDINKCLMVIRNDIEDLRDYIDRLENTYKKSNKHDLSKLKNKVKLMEDYYIHHRTKFLDLENDILNININVKTLSEQVGKRPVVVKDKKLKSDINNTKYSIKKLLTKQNNGTITEKELERLKDKQELLTKLYQK